MKKHAWVLARWGRTTFLGGALLIVLLSVSTGWAATVRLVDYQVETVSINYGGSVRSQSAGEFWVRVTDSGYGLTDFETVAYCIEIDQNIGTGTDYGMDLTPLNPTLEQEKQIAWLMNEYAPAYFGKESTLNSQYGAALQLAIWDVVNAPDDFSVDSGTNVTIFDRYNLIMGALPSGEDLSDLTLNTKFARHDTTQDLVVYNINNVPVPSSLLLLGGGLLALMGFGRRRQTP